MPSPVSSVFISYNRADRDWAEWIAKTIESAGYQPIIQAWDFRPGENFVSRMQEAMADSDLTIAVLSENYLKAEFTQPEWAAAFARDPIGKKRKFVPVRVAACSLTGMLSLTIYIDLVGLNEQDAERALLDGLKPSSKPAQPPSFPGKRTAPTIPAVAFPPDAARLHGVPDLPPHYLPREKVLTGLKQKLLSGGASVAITGQGQAFGVQGMGGIGKTVLAAALAHDSEVRQAFPDGIYWLTIGQKPNLLDLQNQLLRQLTDSKETFATGQEAKDALREALEGRTALVVVDDAWTIDHADAFSVIAPPARLLITTRDNEVLVGIGADEQSVDVLSPSDALKMLAGWAGEKHPDKLPPEAAEVAKECCYLPLALAMIGAIIRLQPTAWKDALTRLRRADLGAIKKTFPGYPYPDLLRAMKVSIDALEEPERKLLKILAWLAPEPIPLSLLEGLLMGDADARVALIRLVSSSLAQWTSEQDGFTIHRFVQEVTRYSEGQKDDALELALSLLNGRLPSPEWDNKGWRLWEQLAPHCRALLEHLRGRALERKATAMMNQFARWLYNRCEYSEAELLLRRALAIDEEHSGPDHPSVATSLNNLAELLRETNRPLDVAEPLVRRALAIDEQFLGIDNPSVARDLNNLALLLRRMNRPAEAEPLLRRALEINEKSFGGYHPSVAQVLNSLAGLFSETNRLTEAEPLYRRALAIDEESSGQDHPKVAIDLNNLATLFHKMNRPAEAAQLSHRVQAIITVIEKQYKDLPPPISYLAPKIVATGVTVEMFRGGGLIDMPSELGLLITNRGLEMLPAVSIAILESGEYTVETALSAMLTNLSPQKSQRMTFSIRPKVEGRIAVNYKVNGDLKAPPLYINATKDNPYVYGDAVKEETIFFGRSEELEQVRRAVTKPVKQDIMIVGERRSGKTSLLFRLQNRLDPPFVPIYVVLSTSEPTVEGVLTLILQTMTQELVKRKLLTINLPQEHRFPYVAFSDALRTIINSAKQHMSDLKIVLLLDEADYLLRIASLPKTAAEWVSHVIAALRGEPMVDERAQNVLRAALQSQDVSADLRAVISGTSDLSTYMSQRTSPFFNHFRFVPLKALTSEEIRKLIVTPASMLGYSYNEAAITRICALSGGQPYYCQALCYEAFGRSLRLQQKRIVEKDVEEARAKIGEDLFDAYVSGVWRRSTAAERRFLSRLARGQSTSNVTSAHIRRLLEWQIIDHANDNYSFASGLVQIWTLRVSGR
jgi:tetratricopeptide (TPR) repeat protein